MEHSDRYISCVLYSGQEGECAALRPLHKLCVIFWAAGGECGALRPLHKLCVIFWAGGGVCSTQTVT